MKTKLHLKPHDGGPFNCMPAREVELNPDRIMANNVVFPWESNPHKVRLFVVGNEFGPVAAAWADCVQDALDEAMDADLLNSFLVDDADKLWTDELDDCTPLGNAGELCDLTNAWIQEVDLTPSETNVRLLVEFAEARGAGKETLG